MIGASHVALVVKNPLANAGDVTSVTEWGRSSGGSHNNPLQYSYLENPMDRGAWWATVHRVAKSQTQLKRLSTHYNVIDKYSSLWTGTSNRRKMSIKILT